MPKRYNIKLGQKEIKGMVGVGKVGHRSAQIWIRSHRPGKHRIKVWPSGFPSAEQTANVTIPDRGNDHTYSVLFPDGFPGLSPLRPLKRYLFSVSSSPDNRPVGTGRFETAPEKPDDSPERFSIAVMSCHQPFDETSGKLSEPSMRMLRLAKRELVKHDAKFIILCGDQIYSDHPKRGSLFDQHYTSTKLSYGKKHIVNWPAKTVRKAYQQRYRQFLWMDEVQKFYANYPCYPMLDDHEIVDDWGAELIHSEPAGGVNYSNIKKGALQAYMDYQASRVISPTNVIPDSFHYSFDYGSVGVFMMDLRTQRSVKPRCLYGPEQLRDLKKYLTRSRDKHVILIITSVPVVHLPDWLTNVGASIMGTRVDFPDHWSYGPNERARNRFLKVIYHHQKSHPHQRLVLVSGDVHIGCVFGINWHGKREPTLYQFTSSAISNKMHNLKIQASVLGPRLFKLYDNLEVGGGVPKADVRLLKAKKGSRKNNPFGGLNLGIIEVERGKAKSSVTLKLLGYTAEDQDRGVEMYISRKL
jgi:alkaline phosphatase D